jgi:hypothetical protein
MMTFEQRIEKLERLSQEFQKDIAWLKKYVTAFVDCVPDEKGSHFIHRLRELQAKIDKEISCSGEPNAPSR